MPRVCATCAHKDRDDIDRALVSGAHLTDLSAKYGPSTTSIMRHRDNHLSPGLQALAVATKDESDRSLLARVESLVDEADSFLQAAKASGSVGQGLASIREMRGLLELLGKATGELAPAGPSVQVVNVQTSPEVALITSTLISALAPFPEARVVAAEALSELEARSPSPRAIAAGTAPQVAVVDVASVEVPDGH